MGLKKVIDASLTLYNRIKEKIILYYCHKKFKQR